MRWVWNLNKRVRSDFEIFFKPCTGCPIIYKINLISFLCFIEYNNNNNNNNKNKYFSIKISRKKL